MLAIITACAESIDLRDFGEAFLGVFGAAGINPEDTPETEKTIC